MKDREGSRRLERREREEREEKEIDIWSEIWWFKNRSR